MPVKGELDTKLIRSYLDKIGAVLTSHEVGLRDGHELRGALADQLVGLLLACDGIGVLETLKHRHGIQVTPVVREGHA